MSESDTDSITGELNGTTISTPSSSSRDESALHTCNIIDTIHAPVPDEDFEVADYSLGRAGVIALRGNVTYIVCGMFIRKHNGQKQVLLVQEAKATCRGSWYVPAGRMEKGETIEEATQREVREEAGIECSCDDLISVEVQGTGWYRFTFQCTVTGGDLKTAAQADSESICAQWFNVDETQEKTFNMRAKDARGLIRHAAEMYDRHAARPTGRCRVAIHPTIGISPGMYARFAIVDKRHDDTYRVLLSRDLVAGTHDLSLPIVEFPLNAIFPAVVSKFYRELFEDGQSVLEVPTICVGVFCHVGQAKRQPHDGVCTTLLVRVKPRNKPILTKPDRYVWKHVTDTETCIELTDLLTNGPQFVML